MSNKEYIPIFTCKLVREGKVTTYGTANGAVSTLKVLYNYFKGADREKLVVILLNSAGHMIGLNTVSIGAVDKSIVHPREVFKPAILAGCTSIIIAHNHPSGSIIPSTQDNCVTNTIVNAGMVLGIPLLDHIIVGYNDRGKNTYYSYSENGKI